MRNLTDEDVKAIVEALHTTSHSCRFPNINEKDMGEAIEFYRNFNTAMKETGSTVRKTITVIGVSGLVTLVIWGIFARAKAFLGI